MMDHLYDYDQSLRRIKTARTEKAINAAAKDGFRPLLKLVKPSHEIKSKIRVCQNKNTGEISLQGDYRWNTNDPDWDVVIDWIFFYPHAWPSPFAAYLIPPDINIDEIVVLEDLIEDLVGASWNQGDVYRLRSCKARWTGNDFILDYDPERSPNHFLG
jgi:hypothetical protein